MARNGEKPNGAKAGWKFRRSHRHFENQIFRVREDEVEVDCKEGQYAYLERDEAVVIVPVTPDGEMVLLKQYRYAIDEWCLEVPAGGTHDTGESSLEEVARKELREEVGGMAQALTYIDFFYPANALSDEKCHVFLAEGVEFAKRPKTEAGEMIEVKRVPVAEAMELARSGGIKTAPCALAVLLCEPRLSRYLQHHRTPDAQRET